MSTNRCPAPSIRPAAAVCLVAAPLVAVVARVLATPWLEDPAEYLTELGRHAGRSDAGSLLALFSALLFIPAVLTLAALVREARPRLSLAGSVLGVAGAFGLGAAACASLIAGQMARIGDDSMVTLWDRIIKEGPMQVFPVLLAAGALGSVLLAVGLYRGRVVPRVAAVLTGVGGAATMITVAGPVRAAVVGAAVVALVAFAWISAVVRRNEAGTFSPRQAGELAVPAAS